MDPLHKPQPSGLLLVLPYGACSYLPPPIFAAAELFFHECGRRVGGVPRSSLKGKETQHDEGEKNTSNPKTKQKPTKQKPEPKNHNTTKGQRPVPPHLKVFPLYEGETIEKGRT